MAARTPMHPAALLLRIARRAKRLLKRDTVALFTTDALDQPYRDYDELRRGGAVQFSLEHDAWLVLGYEEAESVFARPAIFSSEPYEPIDRVLLAAHTPAHTAARRLIARHFSAEVMDRLNASAEIRARALIKPKMDVISDYAIPLVHSVAAELIGFDERTVEEIVTATNATADAPDPLNELIRVLDTFADRAALYPVLLADGKGDFGDVEVRSLIRLLWLAATTTTIRIVVWCVLRLLQDASLKEAVLGDPSLVAPYVEEIMRLHSPEHMIPRRAQHDVELGGALIAEGAIVQLCVSAANRDPRRFDQPHVLMLNRPSNRHLTFGSGMHHCIGAPLARRVIATSVRTLLREMPGFHLANARGEIRFSRTMNALFPERLSIRA